MQCGNEGVGFEPSGLANIFESASSFESLHSPRQHLPNSVYHVRRSSFSRSVDRAGEHTAGEARLRYDVVFVHRAQGVMAE